MKYNIDKGSHSLYAIQFHYVCCVKYRKEVLNTDVSNRIKQINIDIAEKFGINILEQETDKDHIHILFESKPSTQVSKFINSIKKRFVPLHSKRIPRNTESLVGRFVLEQKLFSSFYWTGIFRSS